MTGNAAEKSVEPAETIQKPKHTLVEVVASSVEEGVGAGPQRWAWTHRLFRPK